MIDSRSIPVRFSNLKRMGESPAHYQHAINSHFVASRAMRIGTIAHALAFGTPISVYDGTRRGKEWDAFRLASAGSEIFVRAEVDEAMPIAEALDGNADAKRVLQGIRETPIDWTYCGRAARSTPDVRGPTYVTDLKTTRSAKPATFTRDAFWRGYHAQLAFYQAACGLPGTSPCYIVAVENKAPYSVVVFQAEQRAIDAGHIQCRAWLEQLMVCEDADHWPGYVTGVQSFDIPDRDDIDLTFGEDAEEQDQ